MLKSGDLRLLNLKIELIFAALICYYSTYICVQFQSWWDKTSIKNSPTLMLAVVIFLFLFSEKEWTKKMFQFIIC